MMLARSVMLAALVACGGSQPATPKPRELGVHKPPGGCPAGTEFFVPGCGDQRNTVPFEQGCYARCADGACPAGTTCRLVTHDICWETACDACGGPISICLSH